MSNGKIIRTRVRFGVFLAALFAISGLVSCSGGGGTTTTDTAPAPPTYTITASAGSGGAVTPSGVTSVTQGASQSYNITPNSGYIIATLVVDGTTVANSTSYTFTNVQASHTISATFSVVSAGGIVLSLVPARTSGVALLAVFFDATATTDTGVTTRPFHDLEYTWDFGDPTAGTWANGARPGVSSKNSATGPVAAHVFETPGTYTVTLTVFDGTNTATANTTITVQDPDTVFANTNTICIGATNVPTAGSGGCPTGATTAQQSNFVTAISQYALTGRRVLFRRGDTFTAASSARIDKTGPGTVGAFGTAAAPPKVQMTGNTTILVLSSTSTPGIKDWRVMDLDFDGQSGDQAYGFESGGGIDQLTLLRTNVKDAHDDIVFPSTTLDVANNSNPGGHTIYDQIAIVDSTLTPIAGAVGSGTGWRIYAALNNSAILGNSLGHTADNTATGSHLIRIPQGYKLVISNNSLYRAGGLSIKMHGPTWCAPGSAINSIGRCTTPSSDYLNSTLPYGLGGSTGGYTELNVISDNMVLAGNPPTPPVDTPYFMHLGPQDVFNDERVRNVIIERNWYRANLPTRSEIILGCSEITVRNNMCDLTGGSAGRYCVSVWREGGNNSSSPAPPADQIRIYNNTAYSGDASSSFAAIRLEAGITNITAYNNLAYAPSATTAVMIDSTGCGGLCVTESNNSSNFQVKNNSPFATLPLDLITDWTPAATSYAINGGTPVPVWSDFFRTSRPQNGVMDIGAVESP